MFHKKVYLCNVKYIANIVSGSVKYKFNRYINLCNSIDEIDCTIPTLIIGLANAKKILGENLKHFDREVTPLMRWTYSQTESRQTNEKDLQDFKKYILKCFKKRIEYQFVSILSNTGEDISKFKDFLRLNRDNIGAYFTEKSIFFALKDNEKIKVYGMSFDEMEWLGIKKKEAYLKFRKMFVHSENIKTIMPSDDLAYFEDDDIVVAALMSM